MPDPLAEPRWLKVRIEVPRGSFVKPSPDGERVDLVAPLPSPFNYGSVLGTAGPDGDPWDAVVLGARLPRGTVVEAPVWGRVDFLDGGQPDPKWVVGAWPPRRRHWAALRVFFVVYGMLKSGRDLLRGRRPQSGAVRIVRRGPDRSTDDAAGRAEFFR